MNKTLSTTLLSLLLCSCASSSKLIPPKTYVQQKPKTESYVNPDLQKESLEIKIEKITLPKINYSFLGQSDNSTMNFENHKQEEVWKLDIKKKKNNFKNYNFSSMCYKEVSGRYLVGTLSLNSINKFFNIDLRKYLKDISNIEFEHGGVLGFQKPKRFDQYLTNSSFGCNDDKENINNLNRFNEPIKLFYGYTFEF